MSSGTTAPNGTDDRPHVRALVVDDEAPVANVLRELLEGLGFEVTVACDGQAGLEAFLAARPDLVVTDLLLPRRNGFELVEDFRQLDPSVPIAVVTGIYSGDAYKAQVAHAAAFLGKPIDLERIVELARTVSAAAEQGRAAGTAAAGTAAQAPAPSRSETPAARPSAGPGPTRRPGGEPWIPTSLVPLPRMLGLLHDAAATGLLTHRVGERRTVFTLEDGALRFVRCNEPSLRLDRILFELGQLSEDDVGRAREALAARSTPARFGEVVVEMGLLAPGEVRSAVQVQLRRMIAAAFNEDRGETLFHGEESVGEEDISIDTDIRAVIVAGCAAWDDDERLLGWLPDARCRLVVRESEAAALKLPVSVRQVLSAMAEPTPLGQVAGMAELVGLRGRPLVFGLLCAGVLALAADPEWDPRAGAREDLGTPEGIAPVDTFLRLEEQGATGVLIVSVDEVRASVRFRDGRVVGATSTDERSRLGARLVAAGLVTPSRLDEALAAQAAAPRTPLGRILVDRGWIAPAQLAHALSAQVLGIARDVVSAPDWDEARFEAGGDDPGADIEHSTADLVLAAVRELPEERLRLLLQALAAERPIVDCEALSSGRFTLTDTEEMVTLALARDARQLADAVLDRTPDPDVLRMAVLGLLVSPAGEPASQEA